MVGTRSLSSGPHWRDPLALPTLRNYPRHCERSEAIHVTACGGMDCFVAFAPRNDGGYSFAFSRHDEPEVCKNLVPSKTEGAGKTRCARHPRSPVQDAQKARTRAYRFSGKPGAPTPDGIFLTSPNQTSFYDACVARGAAGQRNGPIHIIGTILGHVDSSKG
jgi:hypothetical protein